MTGLYDKFPFSFERNVGGVLEVIFDGPNLNAVTAEVHAELPKLWPVIRDDEETRVVLVRGAGKGFSAGGSFDLIDEQIADHGALMRVMRETRELVYNMIDFPKPVISAIHGPAVGAGLIVAMMSDIQIAAKNAVILDGHTRLGVTAGDHAALVWPMVCGMSKAKFYLLTCRKLRGEEAERIGLISMCTEPEELLDTAREVASELSFGAQDAIRLTKHSMNLWYRQNLAIFDASLGYEFLNFGGPDVREGVASHREKRAPKFV
jgi:enoyl-CoA hydratase